MGKELAAVIETLVRQMKELEDIVLRLQARIIRLEKWRHNVED